MCALCRLPPECRVGDVAVARVRPIMYYRPASPAGDLYLRVTLHPGANHKKAAGAVGMDGALGTGTN